MENTGTLSKTEYNYIRTIEKADELIAKQKASLEKQKSANEKLLKEIETLKSENEISAKELKSVKVENENLKTEKDVLKKQIAKEKVEIKTEEKPEEKIIYFKNKTGFLHKFPEVEVSPSETEKINSLIADGYEKK